MSADDGNSGDEVFDEAIEDSSDAFPGGSEDEGSMFDTFTGGPKGLEYEAGLSGAFDESVQPAEEPPPYVYGSLKGTNNIRVLDIEPHDDFNAPLRVELRLTSLNDPCKYLALSYAWGQLYTDGSHLCETLFIGGHPLKVTSSLHLGLKRVRQHWLSGQLRLRSAPLTVWVDGACIDQSNQAERGQQVSLMDEIFRSCFALIIYLGDNAEDSRERELFSSPNFLYESAQILHDASPFVVADGTPLPPPGYRRLGANLQPHIDSFRSLLHRSWFARLWVVQEVFNGYGDRTRMIVGDFALVAEAIRRLMADLSNQQSAQNADGDIANDQHAVINCPSPPTFFTNPGKAKSVLEFIQQCERLCCSDGKDRVYALLGAFKHNLPQIQADYSKTVEDVYCEFACRQVEAGNVFQLLACALSRQFDESDRANGSPSWVPDWRISSHFHSKPHEVAARRELSDKPLGKDPYVSHQVLTAQGIVLKPDMFIGNSRTDPRGHTMGPFENLLRSHAKLWSRSFPLGKFDESPSLKLLPSLELLRFPGVELGGMELAQLVQNLEQSHQYLCFFRYSPDAFVIRLLNPGSRVLMAHGFPQTFTLVTFLSLPVQDTYDFNSFLRHIPLETIYLR